MDNKPTMRGATAGALLVATIVLCGLIGLGVGVLIGAPALAAIAGTLVGPPAGFLLVRARFRDL